ncbi:MAG: hypothetical protein ACO3N7_01090 [Kiritimatiellia bacterium]
MKSFLLVFFLLSPRLWSAPLPESVDKPLLMDVTLYLYRWVLDEKDVEPVLQDGNLSIRVKERWPPLDEGDASRFVDLWMPQLSLQISLRKADYRILELKQEVKNHQFKITNILKGEPPEDADLYVPVEIPYAEMEAFAYARRSEAVFPEGEFLAALRRKAREELTAYFQGRTGNFPEGDQQVFFSPLSPVANDLWIFWETGGKLLRLSSDFDLEDPAFWKSEALRMRIFDVREQTVVHLSEVKGSNAYLTRDQVGRYLFNCIVLGKRVLLPPPEGP